MLKNRSLNVCPSYILTARQSLSRYWNNRFNYFVDWYRGYFVAWGTYIVTSDNQNATALLTLFAICKLLHSFLVSFLEKFDFTFC